MIIIRHKTGPLAGKEQQLVPTSDRIMFGRDPSLCDVVYPMEETLVSRQHFALVRKGKDHWTVDRFGTPYVGVDGDPAESGQEVKSGATVALGRPGGPSFEFKIEGAAENAAGVTQAQFKTAPQFVPVSARKMASRATRFGMIGVAAAVIAIGGAAFVYTTYSSDAARINKLISDAGKQQEEIANQSISQAVRDRTVAAAFFVVTLGTDGSESYGTASPIAPDMLATNAHVAESFLTKGDKGRMFVRAPGQGGKTYDVISVSIHPGYRAFQTFLNQDQFFVGDWRLTGAQIASYDVAILRVAPGSNLSPVLELATKEELQILKPGYPLIRAGYPTENVAGSEIQSQQAATPNLAPGIISGLTDMFRLPGDAEHRQLIHHSVPSAGGASGSPLVGPNGKVVALNSAGTYIFVSKEVVRSQRISSSVLINYGQRADWVIDLRDGRADAQLESDRKYWAKQTADFKRGIDVLVPVVLNDTKPPTGGTPVLKVKDKVTFASGDRYEPPPKMGQAQGTKRQRIHPVKLVGGKLHSFIAYAENRAAVKIYLVVDGKIVQQDERETFAPRIGYKAEKDGNAEVYITGPDDDAVYTFFQYEWDTPGS